MIPHSPSPQPGPSGTLGYHTLHEDHQVFSSALHPLPTAMARAKLPFLPLDHSCVYTTLGFLGP